MEGSFALGDSVLDKAVTWVRPGGMDILIAKRTLLVGTSWKDME